MAYCPYCGNEVASGMKYCPNCGAALDTSVVSNAVKTGIYRLIVVSRGSCSISDAAGILADYLGYSDVEAQDLIEGAPVSVAENLTASQARTLAQVFTEYGMEVTIYDKNDRYVDLSGSATSSVLNTDGTLMAAAAGFLAGIGAANRVTVHRTYHRESLLDWLFRPRYQRPAPRKPTRRDFYEWHPAERPRMQGHPMDRPHEDMHRPEGGMMHGPRGGNGRRMH